MRHGYNDLFLDAGDCVRDNAASMPAVEPLNLFSYASRSRQNRWGPFLFKPARRSIILLALTVAAMIWLAARHAAWRSVGEIGTEARYDMKPPDFVPACNAMLARRDSV